MIHPLRGQKPGNRRELTRISADNNIKTTVLFRANDNAFHRVRTRRITDSPFEPSIAYLFISIRTPDALDNIPHPSYCEVTNHAIVGHTGNNCGGRSPCAHSVILDQTILASTLSPIDRLGNCRRSRMGLWSREYHVVVGTYGVVECQRLGDRCDSFRSYAA